MGRRRRTAAAAAVASLLLFVAAIASAAAAAADTSPLATLLAAATLEPTLAALERIFRDDPPSAKSGSNSTDDDAPPWTRLPPRLRARGLSYVGSAARLRRVVDKLLAGSGGRVSVGLVGGSISWGHNVARGREDWFSRLSAWLPRAFPAADISARNGAVPAVQSEFAAMCLSKFVDADADLVFVEFTTNDGWAGGGGGGGGGGSADDNNNLLNLNGTLLEHNSRARAYERLLRKLLSRPSAPAVVAVHFLPTDVRLKKLPFFATAEDHYATLAQYYGVPSISLRDSVWRPMVQRNASNFSVDDVFLPGDERHPSALGHGYMADLARALVETVAWESALLPGLVQLGRRPEAEEYAYWGGQGATGRSTAAFGGPVGAALSLAGGPGSGGAPSFADALLDPSLRAYLGQGRPADDASSPSPSPPSPPPLLPPPMFEGNYEAEAGSSCASGIDLYALPARRDDWYFVNEGSAAKPKWGWVSHLPGAALELPLDLRAAGGGGGGGADGAPSSSSSSTPIRPLPTVSSAQRLALERRAAQTGVPSGLGRPPARGGGKNGTGGVADEDEEDEASLGGAEPVAGWRVASAEAERAAAAAAGPGGGQELLRGDSGWSLERGGEVRGAAGGRLAPEARAAPAALTAGADGVVEVGKKRRRRRRGRALQSAEDWLPGLLGRWVRGKRQRQRRGEPDAAAAAAAAATAAPAPAPSSSSSAPATVYVGYLQSYRAMGRARLSCASGCACQPLVVDAHSPGEKKSQTVLARLKGVVPAPVADGYLASGRRKAVLGAGGTRTPRLFGWMRGRGGGDKEVEVAMCVVRIEVLAPPVAAAPAGAGAARGAAASGGGTKFKVSAVMVSREVAYGAYGDFGDHTMPMALEAQDAKAAGA